MNDIFENNHFNESSKRINEHKLTDLLFHRNYSEDENLQNAFLDGYAIGIMSSSLISSFNDNDIEKAFGENTDLLKDALNGNSTAISILEEKFNNYTKNMFNSK